MPEPITIVSWIISIDNSPHGTNRLSFIIKIIIAGADGIGYQEVLRMIIYIVSDFALLYLISTQVDCAFFKRIVCVRSHEFVFHETGDGHQHNSVENNTYLQMKQSLNAAAAKSHLRPTTSHRSIMRKGLKPPSPFAHPLHVIKTTHLPSSL
jgi:hypothetical protein